MLEVQNTEQKTDFNADEIYSVSDFLSLCGQTIEERIPVCWLRGEISNLSRPASGHWYFSIKDNNSQIRCALFRLNQRQIKFNPENGMEVLLRAAPTLYQARGDFQLIVQYLEPVGVGNLQLAFEQLKNKLKNEGLFASIHKKPLPEKVQTIGIISSSSGAVIHDIIKVLHKRYPFAKVLLFDSIVQGEMAAEKLSYAIGKADNSNCEVLILARGGGSLEDLYAFNEELLARAIFACNTPIISAVGHETDTTIADFVSDIRAPTPSAAAMLATPDRLKLLAKSNELRENLFKIIHQQVRFFRQQIEQLNLRIPTVPLNVLSQKLDGLALQLDYRAKMRIDFHKSKLATAFEQLKQCSPSVNIAHKKQLNTLAKMQLKRSIKHLFIHQQTALNNLTGRLKKSIKHITWQQKNHLSTQANGLNHLSPLNILLRGYSITALDNQLLRKVAKVKIGDTVTTTLSDGKIYAKVKKIEKS